MMPVAIARVITSALCVVFGAGITYIAPPTSSSHPSSYLLQFFATGMTFSLVCRPNNNNNTHTKPQQQHNNNL